jgi:hypothetical protein
MVETLAEKLGNEKTKDTGVIVSTFDLGRKLIIKIKNNFGSKQYVLDKEISGKEISDL